MKQKILAIDDNKDNLTTIKALINEVKPGYEVLTATNGPDGLEIARAEDPDVILLDILMPDMDGFEVCRRLKKDSLLREIPVVFLTAMKESRESRLQALDAGADGFLAKPLDLVEFSAQIRAMLKIRAAVLHRRDERDSLKALVTSRTSALEKELIETKKIEEELNANYLLLRLAGRTAKFGGWSVNLKEMRVQWSDEVALIHDASPGFSPLVHEGMDFYAPEWKAKIEKVFTDCAGMGIPYDEEMEIITAKGRRIWVRTIGEPVFDDTGKVYKVQGSFQDISERKQAEIEIRKAKEDLEKKVVERTAQLQAINKELESFAYSVSHDLRAPLRSINGYAHLFMEKHGKDLDTEASHYLERIHENTTRMGTLIDDLLLLTRFSSSHLTLKTVDLSALAREIGNEMAFGNPGRSVELLVQDGLYSEADPALIKIVLANLLSNAWKFTSGVQHPRIEFGSEKPNEFFVRDNGVGFDPKFSSLLFLPFQRLHSASEFPGTGIGLATVHKIVQCHGGQLRAESQLGRGACFYFSLTKES
jgi:signal transduction histidine kinase/CheY-like chemotaxis protein